MFSFDCPYVTLIISFYVYSQLPDSLSAVEMKDWLTALYDSAGFADADNAANGIKRA
jgi:hypothetical protein